MQSASGAGDTAYLAAELVTAVMALLVVFALPGLGNRLFEPIEILTGGFQGRNPAHTAQVFVFHMESPPALGDANRRPGHRELPHPSC